MATNYTLVVEAKSTKAGECKSEPNSLVLRRFDAQDSEKARNIAYYYVERMKEEHKHSCGCNNWKYSTKIFKTK